jgi:multidrug efflux pump subunit AcrA (membrane-fusion protein)
MKRGITLVYGLIGLALGVSLAACKGEPEKKQVKIDPVPVSVGKVRQISERETITVSGSVNAPDSPASVSFLVSGKVVFAGPREGEYVRRGQALARIDPTDYQLSVQGAEAQSAGADAVLEKTMNPARPEQLEQARITFERAEDEYRRMKMLHESKSLAPNDFLKYKAVYESARQQFELAKAGGQKEDKEQAKAASRQAATGVRIARKALSDSTLCAPISGYISKRYIEVGDTVSPARPAFEIVQLDPVEVTVGVPETDIHRVRIGQKAEIRIPAQPEKTFDGTLRVVNVSADPNTRTYMARIRVPNSDRFLRLGMIAEATIRGDRTVALMTVPGIAVVRDPQGAARVFVYHPDQGRVYAKRVEIGAGIGKDLVIKSGLSGDDRIVLAGQAKLEDGLAVSATGQEDRR